MARTKVSKISESKVEEKIIKPDEVKVETIEAEQKKFEQHKLQQEETFKKHAEKASMAFELLKTAVSEQSDLFTGDSIDKTENYKNLVGGVFELADLFKAEVDTRYTKAVMEQNKRFETQGEAEDSAGKTIQ